MTTFALKLTATNSTFNGREVDFEKEKKNFSAMLKAAIRKD